MKHEITKNLIEELGLENLPEKEKNDLIVSLADALRSRIAERTLNFLTEDDRIELDKLIDQKSDEKMNKFLAEKIPNFDEIMYDEYILFKEETLETQKEVKKLLAE
ncbi:MAG: DUF5663 domain-containing protein [Patescibacteria group bacterium]|jgi:hypothetical protein|nr:DUF5663 domain-containing protein [Patescibacteria group bacterium]